MPNPIPEFAALSVVAVAALWGYFAFRLGPALWTTRRREFWIAVLVAGFVHGWLLVLAFVSGRFREPDTVVAAIIAVVGSIIGAMLGAREGAKATLQATAAFSRQREEHERASVRLLLRLEIDHNLASLRDLRSEIFTAAIRNPSGEAGDPENATLTWDYYARALARVAMPAWTRQAWDSMTALLSPALHPKEIERANHLYGQLETISGIRAQITAMANERPYMVETGIPGFGLRSVDPMTFYEYAPGLASEVDRIILALLASGNPIAEHEEGATESAPT